MTDLESFEDVRRYRNQMLRRYTIVISLTIVCMFCAFIACMAVGNYQLSPSEVWNALIGNESPGAVQVVRRVRLPRVLAAAFVGAGLSVAGLAMQSLFKNPMASPSILGLSAGAAFGASVAISFGIGRLTNWIAPGNTIAVSTVQELSVALVPNLLISLGTIVLTIVVSAWMLGRKVDL